MISFLMGPARCGKTTEIRKRIEACLQKGKRVFLLVPEQFSFQTELAMQKKLGPQASSQMVTVSFPRLCHLIFKEYGGLAGTYATSTVKTIIMNLALQQSADQLNLYQKAAQKIGFDQLMVETMDELKNATFTPEHFAESIDSIQPGTLKDKAKEISFIYTVYDALLQATCKDPLDDLSRATIRLRGQNFFENAVVFVDEFFSFSGAQLQMLEEILQQTDVTFSLCCKQQESLFLFTQHTMRTLQTTAFKHHVTTQQPVWMPERTDVSPDFLTIKTQIFRPTLSPVSKAPTHVSVLLAPNEYEEIDHLLATVWQLVQQGTRFRDIVLLTRDLEHYRGTLESALEKYQIPYFIDEKQPVDFLPLFRCTLGLCQAASGNARMDGIFQVLKSGLTRFDALEISEFENYLYTWDVTVKSLHKPFTKNPRGFIADTDATEKDSKTLKTAEQVRKAVCEAIDLMTQAPEQASAHGQALIDALNCLGIIEQFQLEITALHQTDPDAAKESERVWGGLVEILETLHHTIGGTAISQKRYADLFSIAVRNFDLGVVPQTLDSVLIGSAEHTLAEQAKVVFLFGVNDGVFPLSPSSSGVFSDRDREALEENGVSFSKTLTDRILEERLRAYHALCLPEEHLYLSARLADISGNPLSESEVITQLVTLFGDTVIQKTQDQDMLSLCQTKETAFLQLAFHYRNTDAKVAALQHYFEDDPRLNRLAQIKSSSHFALTDMQTAKALFGKEWRVSPTQVERFFRCPFSYFCANGMRVYPRTRAELNALSLGSVIHAVLEQLLQDDSFLTQSKSGLQASIAQILKDYVTHQLGGTQDKSSRFLQKLQALSAQLLLLAQNMQEEMRQSQFSPMHFELQIGSSQSAKAMTVPLPDGGTVKVVGQIDRVDQFSKDGKTYIRVVDYKSGTGKTFSLSWLYYGLQMQMFLYLFSMLESDSTLLPAGVFYLPSAGVLGQYPFDVPSPSSDQVAQQLTQGFRMSGILLEDEAIVDAMEKIDPGEKGKFIPVTHPKSSMAPKTTANGVFLSLEDLKTIQVFVRRQLTTMCENLQHGNIAAIPLDKVGASASACDWCDYQSVCGHTKSTPARNVELLSTEEALTRMKEENPCQ